MTVLVVRLTEVVAAMLCLVLLPRVWKARLKGVVGGCKPGNVSGEAVVECSTNESGGRGVPRSSPAGRADFSPLVEWTSHPHVAHLAT